MPACIRLLFIVLCLTTQQSLGQERLPHVQASTDSNVGSQSEPEKSTQPLLVDASNQTVRKLKQHANDGVALSAAWEENARAVRKSRAEGDKENKTNFSRFVGFVDGRLSAEIPEWWDTMVSSGDVMIARMREVVSSGNVVSSAKPRQTEFVCFDSGDTILYEPIPHKVKEIIRRPLLVLRGNTAAYEGKNIIGSVDGRPFDLPSDLIAKIQEKSPVGIVCPIREGKAMYVVVTSLNRGPGLIAKLDLPSMKERWRAKIHGSNAPRVAISVPTHLVEPKIGTDGNIYIFGCEDFGAYVEAFSAAKGEPLFRFASNERPTAPK